MNDFFSVAESGKVEPRILLPFLEDVTLDFAISELVLATFCNICPSLRTFHSFSPSTFGQVSSRPELPRVLSESEIKMYLQDDLMLLIFGSYSVITDPALILCKETLEDLAIKGSDLTFSSKCMKMYCFFIVSRHWTVDRCM